MENEKQDYVPFGDEWKKEMMKLSKSQLVDFIKSTLIKKAEAELQQKPIDWDELEKEFDEKLDN